MGTWPKSVCLLFILWAQSSLAGNRAVDGTITEDKTSLINETPLMKAASNGSHDVVKYLIDAGADVNVANILGQTTLMIAAENNHIAIVKILIDASANLDPMDNLGRTASQIAEEKGNYEIVQLLKEAKSNAEWTRFWTENRVTILFTSSLVSVLIFLISIILVFLLCRRGKHRLIGETHDMINVFDLVDTSNDGIRDTNRESPRGENPPLKLEFGETLGSGRFGIVRKAKSQSGQIYAAKTYKNESEKSNFLHEIEIMRMIESHANVINMIEHFQLDDQSYIILEYAVHGNLKEFLMKVPLTQSDLMSFERQVALGMQHLANRQFVHRDLAARNVLVFDKQIVKIADFGLAIHLSEKDYYRINTNYHLPFKWMAPESLIKDIFTSQSDVWSFDVLLWEIQTRGCTPFPQVQNEGQLIEYLRDIEQLKSVTSTVETIEIRNLILRCWNWEAVLRPTFDDIVRILENIPRKSSDECLNTFYRS